MAELALPEQSISEPDRTGWPLRIGFMLVPIGHSAGANIITLLAFRFLTDNLAISAGAAGAIFAFVKIYDGLLDPALGAWSDRTVSRLGRRLPFILAGGILMPIGIALVFNTPDLGSVLAAQAFLTVALMLHASAYTALTIPSIAMLVEVSDDAHERTRLMAYRVLGNSAGVILGSSLPAWLLGYWGATRSGHGMMSLVIAAIVLVAVVAGVWFLRGAPQTLPPTNTGARKRYSPADQFRLAWSNKPFRILAIVHIFVLFGTAITSIGSAYFSKYVLLLGDGALGTYYLIATVGVVGSMPLWVRLTKRIGKKASYMIAMAGFGVMHLAWLTAFPGEAYVLLIARAVVTGMMSGGLILIAYSMLSDAMRYDFIVSGLRREGAFAGFTSLIDKLSAAAGIAVMGGFLSWMGYVASKAGALAVQPPSAIVAIYICLAIVPPLAMLCGLLVLTRYDLDEATLVEPVT